MERLGRFCCVFHCHGRGHGHCQCQCQGHCLCLCHGLCLCQGHSRCHCQDHCHCHCARMGFLAPRFVPADGVLFSRYLLPCFPAFAPSHVCTFPFSDKKQKSQPICQNSTNPKNKHTKTNHFETAKAKRKNKKQKHENENLKGKARPPRANRKSGARAAADPPKKGIQTNNAKKNKK